MHQLVSGYVHAQKAFRTPRLQRWGMELGTFLPYLKVAYRRGCDNGVADFLSRYPIFKNFLTTQAQKPDPLRDDAD